MWNSTFKKNNYKGLKRTPFRRKDSPFLHKRSKLKVVGDNDTATKKQEIQELARFICCYRDGGCVLRDLRNCGGDAEIEKTETGYKIISKSVIQAEHLLPRNNSATFADTRLIVCICRNCHGWKEFHKGEYDELVKSVISKERVELWEKCEQDMHAHKAYKLDLSLAILVLKKELKTYDK